MIKKIILLIIIMITLINYNGLAKYSLDDEYYEIHNPNNWNTAIVDKNGKKLLGGVTNQSVVYLVRDLFTDKPAYMYKRYMGEELVNIKQESNDDSWEYKDISSRTILYDLTGQYLFEIKDFGSINGVGEYIVFSSDTGCRVFDTKNKEFKELGYDAYDGFVNNKIIFYNYSYNGNNPIIDIYNTDFEQVKSIKGYVSNYKIEFGNEKYLLLTKFITENDTVYNYLDKECNLLFPNDVENKIDVNEKNNEQVFLYADKMFRFDMSKKAYISTISTISKEEKEKIKSEIDHYYNNNVSNDNKDANISKIKQLLNNEYAYIRVAEYNNKKIYIAEIENEFIPATGSDINSNDYEISGSYIYYSNIYDKDLNLLKERVKNIDTEPLEFGFIVTEDKVYDFDMNYIKTLPSIANLENVEINGKKYLIDRVDEYFNEKTSQYLYDDKLNLICDDYENIVITYDESWILMTDKLSTKLYDKELNVIKDLKRKIYAINYQFNDRYIVFIDLSNKRYGLLDKNGNVVLDKLKKIESLYDDYIVYQNGFRYGIMDIEGNVIASLSIFDDIKDDADDKDYFVSEIGY